MNELEYCKTLRIETSTLSVWVEQRWIIPQTVGDTHSFIDADIARGRLIIDLIETMDVNESGVDVVMSLIDQVHGLREKLNDIVHAIKDQDETVQRCIVGSLDNPRSLRG